MLVQIAYCTGVWKIVNYIQMSSIFGVSITLQIVYELEKLYQGMMAFKEYVVCILWFLVAIGF